MNPHDDGISLDVVRRLAHRRRSIDHPHRRPRRVDRRDSKRRCARCPKPQRQRTALALLDAYRVPEQPLRGAVAPTEVFREAVRAAKVGPAHDIPHISIELIRKYLTDLKILALL